jgi:hypothetical protein
MEADCFSAKKQQRRSFKSEPLADFRIIHIAADGIAGDDDVGYAIRPGAFARCLSAMPRPDGVSEKLGAPPSAQWIRLRFVSRF